MHISPKILVTALLITAIPVTVGVALTQQNTQQNAAQPILHCGGNIQNPPVCPTGFTCKLGPVPDAGGFCVPAGTVAPTCFPRPACLDATPPCKLPIPVGGWCPPVTTTPNPGNPYQLNCSKCAEVNKDTICFNTADRSSYCLNSENVNQFAPQFNNLCMKCPAVIPSAAVTPTPICIPVRPSCPPGQLCPNFSICASPTPTPTIPLGCKVIPCTIACPVTHPNCCPVRYICPPSISPVNTCGKACISNADCDHNGKSCGQCDVNNTHTCVSDITPTTTPPQPTQSQ